MAESWVDGPAVHCPKHQTLHASHWRALQSEGTDAWIVDCPDLPKPTVFKARGTLEFLRKIGQTLERKFEETRLAATA